MKLTIVKETTKYVQTINPKKTDAEVTQAYEWAKTLESGTPQKMLALLLLFTSFPDKYFLRFFKLGKLDAPTFRKVILVWTNSPDPTPEAETLLPFFGDHS